MNVEPLRQLGDSEVAMQPHGRNRRSDAPTGHTESSGDTPSRAGKSAIAVGAQVRIERDETRYPSRGTWPQFRGRRGVVVEINRAGKGPTEYGVCFTKVTPGGPRDNRAFNWDPAAVAWFKRYEIATLGGDAA